MSRLVEGALSMKIEVTLHFYLISTRHKIREDVLFTNIHLELFFFLLDTLLLILDDMF